jgi:hypothetical protein
MRSKHAQHLINEADIPFSGKSRINPIAEKPINSVIPTQAELEVWNQQYAKAVKADDAETPVHLWDNRVWGMG